MQREKLRITKYKIQIHKMTNVQTVDNYKRKKPKTQGEKSR